jgi:hypothetical protein
MEGEMQEPPDAGPPRGPWEPAGPQEVPGDSPTDPIKGAGPQAGALRAARRLSRRTTALAAGSLALVLLIAVGARAVIAREMCGQHPVILNVAASLDIAPAVQQLGSYFNNLNRSVSGHCAEVEVTEEQPDQVTGQVFGEAGTAGELPADAWVPDSSLWVGIAHSAPRGATAIRPTGISVARSPLVVVVPRQDSQTLARVSQASWPSLLQGAASGQIPHAGISLQLPDPTEDAAGLAAVVEANRTFSASPDPRGELTSLVHNVQPTTPFDNVTALADFAEEAQPPLNVKPVTITSEQAAETYNRAHPGNQLDIVYPGSGGVEGSGGSAAADYELDYPFTLTTADPLKVRVARQFGQVLRSGYVFSSGYVRPYVQQLGFRSADGQADPTDVQFGIRSSAPPASPGAAPGEAVEALQQWKQLNLGSRDLVLYDTSQEADTPVGSTGQPALPLLRQAAALGLALFPDSTQMSAWQYSDRMNGAKPYRVMVPMGPLPQSLGLLTRRQELQQIAGTITAHPGVPAAMFSSILGAYRWMTANYAPGHVNALEVLGSGAEAAKDDISLGTLLAGLRQAYDPQRPVEIIAVSAGNDADLSALSQITAITNGASFVVQKPSDIDRVFFDSVGRRICRPNCG